MQAGIAAIGHGDTPTLLHLTSSPTGGLPARLWREAPSFVLRTTADKPPEPENDDPTSAQAERDVSLGSVPFQLSRRGKLLDQRLDDGFVRHPGSGGELWPSPDCLYDAFQFLPCGSDAELLSDLQQILGGDI